MCPGDAQGNNAGGEYLSSMMLIPDLCEPSWTKDGGVVCVFCRQPCTWDESDSEDEDE